MGSKQSKGVAIEGTKTLSTPLCSPISSNSYGDDVSLSSNISNVSDPGEQLYQLLSTSLDDYAIRNDCNNSHLWTKIMRICDMNPTAAAYTEPESFETPLHLACRIIERFPSSVTKDETTTSAIDAVRVLVRCCAESVSKTDIDGYIPLHYIIPHSLRPEVSHQQQRQQQNAQLNHLQNQVLVLNLLMSADFEASVEYLSRSDVRFSPAERACTPLYYAVSSINDDFLQYPCPTVDLISAIHSACPGMVSVKNRDNQDTPLSLLYRRFSKQLDLSEIVLKKPRKEFLEHRLMYKISAMNTWKIILKLLVPTDNGGERGREGKHQLRRQRNANDIYIVHSAVKMDCPPDLIRYIIKTRPGEVSKVDEQGRLPLHIAAAITPLKSPDADNNEDSNYHSKVIIEELLYAYPDGATFADRDGKLPLQLAIESGKFWIRDGVKSLYDVFPEGMTNIVVSEYSEIEKDDGCISMPNWQNCMSH